MSDLDTPARSNADGGTYHGSTLRLETPAKPQKPKREGHRQSYPLMGGAGAGARPVRGSEDAGGITLPALVRNSPAEPHKCEGINPSTGNPCNTIFSQPHDLTRHEETIHDVQKQDMRCDLCTEERTFSRGSMKENKTEVIMGCNVLTGTISLTSNRASSYHCFRQTLSLPPYVTQQAAHRRGFGDSMLGHGSSFRIWI